jgi:hypothetical protein
MGDPQSVQPGELDPLASARLERDLARLIRRHAARLRSRRPYEPRPAPDAEAWYAPILADLAAPAPIPSRPRPRGPRCPESL